MRRPRAAAQPYLPSRSIHSVMNNAFGSGDTRADVRAVVKWFNATKGFGFVQPSDGSPDAFLHVSVLQEIGRSDLPEGAEVICSIQPGRKGLQVAAITSIEHEPEGRPAPRGRSDGFGQRDGYGQRAFGGYQAGFAADGTEQEVEGTVKFFNAE